MVSSLIRREPVVKKDHTMHPSIHHHYATVQQLSNDTFAGVIFLRSTWKVTVWTLRWLMMLQNVPLLSNQRLYGLFHIIGTARCLVPRNSRNHSRCRMSMYLGQAVMLQVFQLAHCPVQRFFHFSYFSFLG